jgi:AcrR family transcriptional regulator
MSLFNDILSCKVIRVTKGPQPLSIVPEADLDALLDDPKAVQRLKLLRATMQLIADRGLDVTMDDIAEAADINRRTLFRQVESRDVLVADALSALMDWYATQIERVAPDEQPLDEWIAALALQMMEIQRAAGLGLWQLTATPDDRLPPELAAVNARRRSDRRQNAQETARSLWKRAGGTGQCPQVVIDAVAMALSNFATRSMVEDFGRDVASVASSVGMILTTVVQTEVEAKAQRSTSTR